MPFATVTGDFGGEALSGDRLKYLKLWDVYGPLLTEAQREICERYYLCDLSLSEIAEEKGISKQAVSDALKTSRELLDSYEEKLHVAENDRAYSLAVSDMMTNIVRALAAMEERHPELSAEIAAVAELVSVGGAADPEKEE